MSEQSETSMLRSVPDQQFRAEQLNSWASAIATGQRQLLVLAAVVLVSVFGFGGFWAATAEIGGAVTGAGRVVAAGNNHIVQHLEGGIIEDVLVEVGDIVKSGDPLATLDTTRVTSQLRAAQVQRAILVAELERWRAESADADNFIVSRNLLEPMAANPRVLEAVASQKAEFAASLDVKRKQISMLDSKIDAEQNEIRSLEATINGLDEQGTLIESEHADLAKLLEQGLTARPRVLALERAMSQRDAQRANAKFSVAQSQSNISAFREEQQKISLEYREMANKNVTRVQGELNSLTDIEARLTDMLKRSAIRSPSDGIVFRLYKKTKGAVLGAGESFAEIFPDQEELNIEALVQPKDITHVELGQEVSVVFPSDHRANLVPVGGTVKYISTDTIIDERTGAASFIVHVLIRKEQEDRRILPGNTADVFFRTDPKTLVELIAEPITRFAFRSFKG